MCVCASAFAVDDVSSAGFARVTSTCSLLFSRITSRTARARALFEFDDDHIHAHTYRLYVFDSARD